MGGGGSCGNSLKCSCQSTCFQSGNSESEMGYRCGKGAQMDPIGSKLCWGRRRRWWGRDTDTAQCSVAVSTNDLVATSSTALSYIFVVL